MKLSGIPTMVFNDYKKTSLYIPFINCTLKCVKEAKERGEYMVECQNHSLLKLKEYLHISVEDIKKQYIDNNPFIEAVILSGLDPFDSWEDAYEFITEFRKISDMEIVIFTGYEPFEIHEKLLQIKNFSNIIIKFGRYKPLEPKRYDEIGMITLISGNQRFIKLEDLSLQ